MFIIDFDNTLFNTTASGGFRDVRVKKLAEIRVNEELYSKTYMIARNTFEGLASYNDERHAEVLSQFGFDKKKVLDILDESIQPKVLKTFLLPGVVEFLEELKRTGEPLVLLSLGDPEYQYLKFKGTGIDKYFDRVFMTNKPKKEIMEEIFSHVHEQEEDIWFINDRISENVEMSKMYPKMKVVQKVSVHSSEEEYQATGLPFFKTLPEIKDYILKYV